MANGKILLFSDGSKIFPALDRFFTDEGYQVLTTWSRQGAVSALRSGNFPLMITRLSRNRLEVAALLRSIRRRNARTVTIFLRGEHEVNSPIEAYEVKGKEEIFIPCGWAGLRRLVASCLND